MAQFHVKSFSSDMHGAPRVNGTPGTFIELLKKCLITGFGEVTAMSSRIEGERWYLEVPAQAKFFDNTIVAITGAADTELNTEHRIEAVVGSTIVIKTKKTNAAGTIKIKMAPVGNWSTPFTATNKATFKSTHPNATSVSFFLDDTFPMWCRIRMQKDPTAIGVATEEPNAEPQHMLKSVEANATNRAWMLVADGKTVYWWIAPYSSRLNARSGVNGQNVFSMQSFGTYIPLGFASKLCAFVQGCSEYNQNGSPPGYDSYIYTHESDPTHAWNTNLLKRTLLFFDPVAGKLGMSCKNYPMTTAIAGMSGWSDGEPKGTVNRPSNSILSSGIFLVSDSGDYIGRYPALRYILHDTRAFLHDKLCSVIDSTETGEDPGKLLIVPASSGRTYSETINRRDTGAMFVDLTGPWR